MTNISDDAQEIYVATVDFFDRAVADFVKDKKYLSYPDMMYIIGSFVATSLDKVSRVSGANHDDVIADFHTTLQITIEQVKEVAAECEGAARH